MRAAKESPEKAWERVAVLHLKERNFRYAVFESSAFKHVDFSGADLRGADLRETELHGADLREAELHGADLRDAELYAADLRETELAGADLREARLTGANLNDTEMKLMDVRFTRWAPQPRDWNEIKENIRAGLRIGGWEDKNIDVQMESYDRIAKMRLGVSMPNRRPDAESCVWHDNAGPAEGWPAPDPEKCAERWAERLSEIACLNRWTARRIAGRLTLAGTEDDDGMKRDAMTVRLLTGIGPGQCPVKACSVTEPYCRELRESLDAYEDRQAKQKRQ